MGAGGHGREILDLVEAVNAAAPTWQLLGFVSDGGHAADPLSRRELGVVGSTEVLLEADGEYVIAIGTGEARRHVDLGAGRTERSPVLLHPAATVAQGTDLGPGVLVPAGATIAVGARLGRHTTLNVNAVVGRHCVIGDYATISPGCRIGEGARLDEGVFVGIGAEVDAGCHLGSWSNVGAGAVVAEDVPAHTTVVGAPKGRQRTSGDRP